MVMLFCVYIDLSGSRMSKIIAGSGSAALAAKIATELKWPLLDSNINRFGDGEISIGINDILESQDVYIIQSTASPVNDNLIELLLIADGAKRAQVRSITAVMAYFGYGRADRQVARNGAVAAQCVASMLENAGISYAISVDLHSVATESFFKIPLYNISPAETLAALIGTHDCVIISPDAGGEARAARVAALLARPCFLINKERDASGKCAAKNISGDVRGKICCIIDDIIDSGDTLCLAAELLIANGAAEVVAYVTHGVLSGDACARIDASPLKLLYISDSIAYDSSSDKIKIFSIAKILAKQIRAIS